MLLIGKPFKEQTSFAMKAIALCERNPSLHTTSLEKATVLLINLSILKTLKTKP
jgi:hypothetical protein